MNNEQENPPEDFRILSVSPTVKDLKDLNPYLRACKINEPYESVDHYLDVQFRVLREDFISPLRKGLTEYIEGGKKYQNNDLRVYKNVRLMASAEINKNNNVGIKLFFGVLKNIKWQDSKRLMFGGFIMLSCNDFKNIIFATVIDRDEKKLKQGYIIIQPIEGTVIDQKMYEETYVMLESKIYYEPYQAVLNSMKLIGEDNFPMRNYLVYATKQNNFPQYLKNKSMLDRFDPYWNKCLQNRLDVSQYNAFKHALDNEFAIIQGPPGTGKTFIALEVVDTLLNKENLWSQYGPIVVVCYTNHALDQFLDGILGKTKSIVRIGDRSKNEKLKPFTLREKRQFSMKNRNLKNVKAKKALFLAKRELENTLTSLSKAHKVISFLTTSQVIVPLEILTIYGAEDEELMLFQSNEDLVEWLTGETVMQHIYRSQTAEKLPKESFLPSEEDENDEHNDDYFHLTYSVDVAHGFTATSPINDLNFKLKTLADSIKNMNECISSEKNSPNPGLFRANCEHYFQKIELCNQHHKILTSEKMILIEEFNNHPILNKSAQLSTNERWRKYWKWIRQSYNRVLRHLNSLKNKYNQSNLELNRAKQIVDVEILQQHKIIGLTTTCAARLHVTLQALHAPIVLVEEAAEILESHILCSMTEKCQHVILIGDHQQLRPKPSDYKTGKDFNLEISLFERVVKIRGACNQLNFQHRMRPEIVQLITPSIYKSLENDKLVYNFPNVKGLKKNLFFLNHDNPESKHNEESWTNPHEAKFLIAFAKHLVKQGYDAKDITVLCTYIGQVFELRKERNKLLDLKNLYITSVDNYQGEENRIILLSLVRNNGEGKVGFLKEENRVCVALSRAKEGLYIMGNMNDLIAKNQIWPKIKKILEDQEAIGDSLSLQCQNHPEQSITVRKQNDFLQCPEGGCTRICGAQLDCGHMCSSVCHILDKEHTKYQCKKKCIKLCPHDHPCPLKCFEKCKPCRVEVSCTLKCGHTVKKPCAVHPDDFLCHFKVKVILPDCGHEVEKPCCLEVKKVRCSHPCENRVESCGHACTLLCHVNTDPDHIEYKCKKRCIKECNNEHPCKKFCYEKCGACPIVMTKTRSCTHVYKNILCSVNIEEKNCEKPCKLKLLCGHDCPMKCSQPCGNCYKKVKKTSSCGHEVSVKCCQEATPSSCTGPCQKMLDCGHRCNKRCKDPCAVKCEVKVKLGSPGLCGHIFSVPCYLKNTDPKSSLILPFCDTLCLAMLKCNHRCNGTCGKCLQGRIHLTCDRPCSNILVCGHECPIPCRENCQPCKKPCEVKCKHSKCKKKCGISCTPCNEPCDVGCEHQKCTKRCSQLCNIQPCSEPCKKLLKCEHPCVGFCGEPCPPLCRICDKEELTTILFGNEDDENARFVYLEDCNHCIESNALLTWMESGDGSIQQKKCPKCTCKITHCQRFSNQIKEFFNDVLKTKEKIFSKDQENLKDIQVEHVETLKKLQDNIFIAEFVDLNEILKKMLEKGSLINQTIHNKKKIQQLSFQEIEAFKLKLEILEQILNILSVIKNLEISIKHVKPQISLIVKAIPEDWVITNQNLDDIQLELTRLQFLIEVCNKFQVGNELDLKSLLSKVLSPKKFVKDYEIEVREEFNKMSLKIQLEERKMINKAFDLKPGHWFKCPNGHIYVITECGGAMEESKCPECKAPIGGSNHRLLHTNTLASEMDGATQAAWPQ